MIHALNIPPATDKEGFANDNPSEAGYILSDIIDTFSPDRVLFAYDGGSKARVARLTKKKHASRPDPRGTMTDKEWSRIVD